MEANFEIDNVTIEQLDNCILVFNYHFINVISNVPRIYNENLLLTSNRSIVGIWKIKNIKQ